MTTRLTETLIDGTHGAGKGLVTTDANGKILALDGSQLTGLPPAPVSIANNFDSFEVEVKNTNFTAASGKLYFISGTCTATMPAVGSSGQRIAFSLVSPTATLSIVTSVGSGGTGLRTIINGESMYGNAIGNANYSWSNSVAGTTFSISGLGKSLHFTGKAAGDGGYAYGAWLERGCNFFRSTFGGDTNTGAGTNSNFVSAEDPTAAIGGSYTHPIPAALVMASSSLFVRTSGTGHTVTTTMTSTQGGSASMSSTLNFLRGYKHQYYPVRMGNSAATTTNRTAQMSMAFNSNDSYLVSGTPYIIAFDGKAETLTAGYGTEGSFSYKLTDSRGGGVSYQQLKLADSTTTSAINAFDWFENRSGVQQITKMFGMEIIYSPTLNKNFCLRHYSKANQT